MMKKYVCVLMSILLVALATGCEKKDVEETVENTSETEMVNNDTLEKTNESNPYEEILSEYKLALSEQWDMEKLMNEGVSPLCLYCYGETPDLSKVGYLMSDLDGNGEEELVIGSLSEDEFTKYMIFDLYTQVDGNAVQVFQGQERDRYYSTNVDLIYNEGSGGAGNSAYCNFKLEGSSLTMVEGLINHGMDDPENPWSYATDADGDTSNDKAIADAEAQTFMQTYMGNRMTLEYQPFSTLE